MEKTDLKNFRVLGCSGGIGGLRRTTSFLLDKDILLDCGTGVGDLTLEELRAVRHIFITHAHLDHVCMLPLLVDSIFDSLEKQPITLYASQAVLDVMYQHLFNWQIWPDFFTLPSEDNPVLISRPLEIGESVPLGGRVVRPLPVDHAVASQGYVVTVSSGRTLAFSGDTRSGERFWDSLNQLDRLDHLLVECAYPEHQRELAAAARHYTPSSLAEDLRRMKHKPDISVIHLKPGSESLIGEQLRGLAPEQSFRLLQSGDLISL